MRKILEHCYGLCESCQGRKDGHESLVQNYLDDLLHGKYRCRGGCLDFADSGEKACLECVSSWMEYIQSFDTTVREEQ